MSPTAGAAKHVTPHRQLEPGEMVMSFQATSIDRGWRERMRKVMSMVDRVALGLMYSLVIAMLPLTAVSVLTRTV
jgi:hypothetical protein